MPDNQYKENIQSFYKGLCELKSQSSPIEVLHIYAGSGNPQEPHELLKTCPSNTILLYLYPPGGSITPKALDSQNTLIILPLDNQADCTPDKISLAITVFAGVKIKLSVCDMVKSSFSKELSLIDQAIRGACGNQNFFEKSLIYCLKSSILNLPQIIKNAGSNIENVPQNASTLICGAGPSLKKQFETIKKYRDRIFLIAVGHAVPALVEAGIKPDLIAELDLVSHYNWQHHNLEMDCPLLAAIETAPPVVSRFEKVIWFSEPLAPIYQLLESHDIKLPVLKFDISVVTSAIDFAVKSGFSRIGLAGLDLSYPNNETAHTGKSLFENLDKQFLHEIPKTGGGAVLSSNDFISIRDSISQYCKKMNDVNKLLNCTPNGANIEGIKYLDLNEFFMKSSPDMPALNFKEIINKTPDFQAVINEIDSYIKILDNLLQLGKALSNEIKEYPVKASKLKKVEELKNSLNQYLTRETEQRSSQNISFLTKTVFLFSEQILRNSNLSEIDLNTPPGQVVIINKRYQLIYELTKELFELLKQGLTGNTIPTSEEHVCFSSFKNAALEIVKTENRLFAEMLDKNEFEDSENRFEIYGDYKDAPYVKLKQNDGSTLPLSEYYNIMDAKALNEIDSFLQANDFHPESNVMVFVAPGNWVHVLNFIRKYPDCPIIVLEPWPELFTKVIKYWMFLHRLPPKTLIAGIDDKLKNWQNIVRKKLKIFKNNGKKPLYFVLPAVAKLPEITSLTQALKSKIE